VRMIGPFEIHEPLARGGHAVVHRARWSGDTPGDLVAKIAIPGTELALHRENATLRAVEHGNLISPVGFVDDATHAALVLPRAACSLRAHLGRLDDSQAFPVAVAITAALAALHRAGYVHDDVTAGNILLLDDGTPVLSDLGSAVPFTDAGERSDIAALARTLREVMVPDASPLRELAERVERAPCEAAAFALELQTLDITPRAIDVHAAPPVALEPPTIVVAD
jgi:serine/threonine protein kinase